MIDDSDSQEKLFATINQFKVNDPKANITSISMFILPKKSKVRFLTEIKEIGEQVVFWKKSVLIYGAVDSVETEFDLDTISIPFLSEVNASPNITID